MAQRPPGRCAPAPLAALCHPPPPPCTSLVFLHLSLPQRMHPTEVEGAAAWQPARGVRKRALTSGCSTVRMLTCSRLLCSTLRALASCALQGRAGRGRAGNNSRFAAQMLTVCAGRQSSSRPNGRQQRGSACRRLQDAKEGAAIGNGSAARNLHQRARKHPNNQRGSAASGDQHGTTWLTLARSEIRDGAPMANIDTRQGWGQLC